MKDFEKIRILDDVILSLEIDQDYFDLDDDCYKLHHFDKAGIEFDILSNYIIRMGEKLTEVRKMLREWSSPDREKGGAA